MRIPPGTNCLITGLPLCVADEPRFKGVVGTQCIAGPHMSQSEADQGCDDCAGQTTQQLTAATHRFMTAVIDHAASEGAPAMFPQRYLMPISGDPGNFAEEERQRQEAENVEPQ